MALRTRFAIGPLPILILGIAGSALANVPGTVTTLSNASASDQQEAPAISQASVVWTDVATASDGSKNDDIYLYDVTAGGPAIDLTNTPNEQEFLEDIDGSNVVWTQRNSTVAGDIVAYDTSTGLATTVASATGSVHYEQPSIGGRYIVFVRVGNYNDIQGYDLAGQYFTQPVTRDAAVQARPRVSGDYVVYEDYGSGNADVYGYQISTAGPPFAIATGADAQSMPDIDGNTVVWVDTQSAPGGGTVDQIFAYDLTTHATTQLTTVASHKILPRIAGSRVVWADDRNGDLDLYSYDLSSATEDVLVSGPGDQFLSDVSGNRVVYTDNSSGFEEVKMFTISGPPPSDLPFGCDPDKTDAVGAPVTLTVSGRRPAYAARSFRTAAGRRYFVCVDNGKPDGSERTTAMLFGVDAALYLTPADFRPVSDPPRHVAAELHFTTRSPLGGLHIWGAALFGPHPPSTATVTIRVAK